MKKLTASLLATGSCLLVICSLDSEARADDGIWLWNQLPKQMTGATGASGSSGATKPDHSMDIRGALADNLRLATVRLNNGAGSGSFVSASGLILTNQHLVAGCLAKLSAKITITPPTDISPHRRWPNSRAPALKPASC